MHMTQQRRADGSLRHLLTLEGLSRDEIESLLERAQHHVRRLGEPAPQSDALAGVTVANMFTEPSTRTRVSFELAAKRLGADVVNLEVQLSSRVKGESMLDTVFTLEALHVDVFVLRDAEAGVPALVASQRRAACQRAVGRRGASVASHAGTARCADDPAAQAALRWAVDRDRRRHPPLARRALGLPRAAHAGRARPAPRRAPCADAGREEFAGCSRCNDIDHGIAGADVVMMLRIQNERFADTAIPAGDDYFREFGLTAQRLRRRSPMPS